MGMTWGMSPSVWGPGDLLSYTNSSVLNHFSFWNGFPDKECFCVFVGCRLKVLDGENGYVWIATSLRESRKAGISQVGKRAWEVGSGSSLSSSSLPSPILDVSWYTPSLGTVLCLPSVKHRFIPPKGEGRERKLTFSWCLFFARH